MSSIRVPQPAPLQVGLPSLKKVFSTNAMLAYTGVAMLIILAGTLIGLVVDPRVITGQPAWLKPAKFAISLSIYCFTLLWMLTFVEGKPRLINNLALLIGGGSLLEIGAISFQALRGFRSHFNATTPFDAAIYYGMGVVIAVVTAGLLVLAVVIISQKKHDPALRWSLGLGLLVTVFGSYIAFTMARPTPAQLESWQAGSPMVESGGHAVGTADGGPGLPIMGWSTQGGDMRVAHFFGVHALQVIPLMGWLLSREAAMCRLSTANRVGMVWAWGLGYLGVIVVFYVQALRGQPVTAPDALTLCLLGVVIAAPAVGMAIFGLRGRSQAA